MDKALKNSAVAAELKKEYLREHLQSVKGIIRSWMAELHPPEPFAPDNRSWGWQTCYQSPREENPDENHMLRHHLKSRALWSHHNNWERNMNEIWQLTEQVCLEAKTRKDKQSGNKSWKYSDDYIPLALWKAFEMVLGRVNELPFSVPGDQLGLCYGAFRIEGSVNTSEARLLVEEEYRNFIYSLSKDPTMKQIAESWLLASQLEEQMITIADISMKSGDIFYLCRFCKHLWK
jgi:hypothetical protein